MGKAKREKIRGVVEGFYGYFFSFHERDQLIGFLSQHDFNFYMYGPKNDRYHRDDWRTPYPQDMMRRFQTTIDLCQHVSIAFCYAISPGLSIEYHSKKDISLLLDKLSSFFDLGVRDFSLFLDDIQPQFVHPADASRFTSFAEAHADLCNRVFSWLHSKDQNCTLSMCPTYYSGQAPFNNYLTTLGNQLVEEIDIIYTGPEVCSHTILSEHVQDLAQVILRPPLIWDNYPVNDGDMASELHIGPIQGRNPELLGYTIGILINPMNLVESSKIPILTYADFFADPQAYDPDVSWKNAIEDIAGESIFEAFKSFAEITAKSCLKESYAGKFELLITRVINFLEANEAVSACAEFYELKDYLNEIRRNTYRLVIEIENSLLRTEILPWIELLDISIKAGLMALSCIKTYETSSNPQKRNIEYLEETFQKIKMHPKSLHSIALYPLIESVLTRCKG